MIFDYPADLLMHGINLLAAVPMDDRQFAAGLQNSPTFLQCHLLTMNVWEYLKGNNQVDAIFFEWKISRATAKQMDRATISLFC